MEKGTNNTTETQGYTTNNKGNKSKEKFQVEDGDFILVDGLIFTVLK